jgi:hypothetical protein
MYLAATGSNATHQRSKTMKAETQVLSALQKIESNRSAWPAFVTNISHEIGEDLAGEDDICVLMRVRKSADMSLNEMAKELNRFDATICSTILRTGTNAWPSFRVIAD